MEKSIRFTYHATGIHFSFNPFRIVYDPQTDSKRRMLDIHKDQVRTLSRKDVYILDNHGKEVMV